MICKLHESRHDLALGWVDEICACRACAERKAVTPPERWIIEETEPERPKLSGQAEVNDDDLAAHVETAVTVRILICNFTLRGSVGEGGGRVGQTI